MRKLAIFIMLLSPVLSQAQGLQFDRINPAAVNGIYYVDGRAFTTIQAAITAAGTTGAVVIPAAYAGIDSYTNPNSILILDLRAGVLGVGTGGTLSVATGNITNINSTGNDSFGTVAVSGTTTLGGQLNASGGLVAGQITKIATGVSGNTDINGELTMSGGSNSYTWSNSYTSHPICTASDETSISAVKVTYTGATSVTFTTSGASDVVSYLCVGRN